MEKEEMINDEEIEAAGFSEQESKRIKSIARRISKAALEAEKMGIEVFGGSSSGTLRFNDSDELGRGLILAELSGRWDGGEGGTCEDNNGLLRGE